MKAAADFQQSSSTDQRKSRDKINSYINMAAQSQRKPNPRLNSHGRLLNELTVM